MRPLFDHVVALAQMAQASGLDGVVASPQETAAYRMWRRFRDRGPGYPGSLSRGGENDQVRTMGPAEAIKAGASYPVVGRPIIATPNQRSAAQRIVEEMQAGS